MNQPWFSDKRSRLISDESAFNVRFYETRAKNIFEKYFTINKTNPPHKSTDHQERLTTEWLSTVLHRGTSRDKILALAYLIKSKPKYSLRELESLLAHVLPAKKQSCLKAIEILSNLFESCLLPNSRTLISFENRPFENISKFATALQDDLSLKMKKETLELPVNSFEYVLCLWYFEHQLKLIYSRFLSLLENVLMSDTIPAEKSKALNALITLVARKPENKESIISILVNKLGDRSKTIASSITHKLRLLISQHENLKPVLVDQIRSFLFRPNLVERAKYYAIVLLSNIPLSKPSKIIKDIASDESASELSAVLFKVYISYFRASTASDELPEKMTAALLTGISRVSPYLTSEQISSDVTDIDAIFKLVQNTKQFAISLQALAFLFHFTSHHTDLKNRYYQSLYRKLSDQSIQWSSRGPTLLHLLYRSLAVDRNVERRAAFTQRLLNVCLGLSDAGFVAGVQILLEKVRTSIQELPSIICVAQVEKEQKESKPTEIRSKLLPVSIGAVKQDVNNDSDSDEEHFIDIPASDEEELEQDSTQESTRKSLTIVWDHKKNLNSSNKKTGSNFFRKSKNNYPSADFYGYDPSARDPRFAKALNQPCWQLLLLTRHSHPTVSLFSRSLLANKVIKYTGNPFEDLSHVHFFERFVYKKPKVDAPGSKSKSNISMIGKYKKENNSDKIKNHAKTLSVDSLAYRNLNTIQVPSDEQFIHSYFNFLGKTKKIDDSESNGSISDTEFDEYLQKHEKGLIPDEVDIDDFDNDDFDYEEDINEEPEDVVQDMNEDELSEDDVDSEEEFAPSSSNNRSSSNFDLSKIFQSAEEVGNLYDTQETQQSAKRQKWVKKRLADQRGIGPPSCMKKRRKKENNHRYKGKKHM